MEKLDPEKFFQEENLSSMKINNELTMEYIYNKIKEKNYSFNEIQIEIIGDGLLRLNLKGKTIFEYLFEEPMKIEFKNKKIDIISLIHLKIISEKYNIIVPVINCETCKIKFKIQIDYLKIHRNHKLLIEESINFKTISEEIFKSFFDKEQNREKGIFGKEFQNPEEFEKNFRFYIKDCEIYKNKPFKFYDNKERRDFIMDLTQNITCSSGTIYSYFGQSGMGKSISILAITKYIINHQLYGTLYLNMKCLNFLLKNKQYLEFRQLIIDEIPYLFCAKYDDYLKCVNIIYKFIIQDEDSIWVLLNEIIKYIFENISEKRYTFIFDQYNNKIDKNGHLTKINNEYVQNLKINKNKFGIITLSSMNNKDIKDYIGKIFLPNFQIDKNNEKNFKELSSIFDENCLKFEDDSIDEYYESLGRNIKYYNILNDCFINQKNMDKLIDEIKQNIKNKMKKFYDCDTDEKNIKNLLYFSTETKYNLDSFLGIVKYIPFKYFIPKIETEINGEKYIQIYFAFPLIEEITNEFLEKIIYFELNIYATLCKNKDIDGGARGQMFEKFVTHQLTPDVADSNRKIFFDDIIITETISLRKFIPRKNEKKIREKKKKITLKNGTYLFTQKILNGKALDILIINIGKSNNAKIIEIQITIHKPDHELFINSYLKDISCSLKENLNKIYDFKIKENEMFFVYIFDKSYKKINEKGFERMINVCEVNSVSYMLFDPDNINFCDKNGKIIKNLGDVVKCPFIPSYKRFECDDSDIIKDISLNFPKEKFPDTYNNTQPFEMQDILKILKNDTENGDKIKDLKYIGIKVIRTQQDFAKDKIYFGRRYEDNKAFIIYFSKKRKIFCCILLENNNKDESELLKNKSKYCPVFDEYKIVKSNNY